MRPQVSVLEHRSIVFTISKEVLAHGSAQLLQSRVRLWFFLAFGSEASGTMPHPRSEMTLREHVLAASRLNRELAEHLEQSLIPKVHELRRVSKSDRPGGESAPSDRTIHAQAAEVLEHDNFAVDVYQQMISHCESIRKTVRELTGG